MECLTIQIACNIYILGVYLLTTEDDGDQRWLVGDSFTLADIYLSLLLARMVLMGVGHSVWEQGKLPAVAKYLEQVST